MARRAVVAVNSGREPARLELAAEVLAGLAPIALPEMPAGRLTTPTTIELPPQGALVLV